MTYKTPNPNQFADLDKYKSFHSAQQVEIDRRNIRAFAEGALIRQHEVVRDKFYFPSLTRLTGVYSQDGSFKSYEIAGGWLSLAGAMRCVGQWNRHEETRQALIEITRQTHTPEQIERDHPFRHLGQTALPLTV